MGRSRWHSWSECICPTTRGPPPAGLFLRLGRPVAYLQRTRFFGQIIAQRAHVGAPSPDISSRSSPDRHRLNESTSPPRSLDFWPLSLTPRQLAPADRSKDALAPFPESCAASRPCPKPAALWYQTESCL